MNKLALQAQRVTSMLEFYRAVYLCQPKMSICQGDLGARRKFQNTTLTGWAGARFGFLPVGEKAARDHRRQHDSIKREVVQVKKTAFFPTGQSDWIARRPWVPVKVEILKLLGSRAPSLLIEWWKKVLNKRKTASREAV